MMRVENLQEYFLKGRLLEAMAARKRLAVVTARLWATPSDLNMAGPSPELLELEHIAAMLPREHSV
jgi:hypothetical protein